MGCNSSQDAKKVEEAATNGKKESANATNHVPDSPEKLQDISEDITPAKSEGTSALEDIEFGEEEEKAATKIQAVFRGHQVRRKFVPVDEAAIDEEIGVKPVIEGSVTKEVDHKIEKAKEAIQEEVKMSGGKVEHEPSKAELEAEFDPQDKDLCHAATKIQASFRGHQVRKQTEKTEKAEDAVKPHPLTPYRHHRMKNNSVKSTSEYSASLPVFMAYNLNEDGSTMAYRPYDHEDSRKDSVKWRQEMEDLLEELLGYLKVLRSYIADVRPVDKAPVIIEEESVDNDEKLDFQSVPLPLDDRIESRTSKVRILEEVRENQKKLVALLHESLDEGDSLKSLLLILNERVSDVKSQTAQIKMSVSKISGKLSRLDKIIADNKLLKTRMDKLESSIDATNKASANKDTASKGTPSNVEDVSPEGE